METADQTEVEGVRGSARSPLGVVSAWPTTAPSLTAARGPFSRNPRPGAQEGVSSISAFNTPRTVIGLVRPRGAHPEVGPGSQLGEACDFFWCRRWAERIEEGPGESGQFCSGLAGFGGLPGWELLPGVYLGPQSKQWSWHRLPPWDHSSNTWIPP